MSRTIRNIAAIAGKECRGYFVSPVGWIVLGFFGIIFGWAFTGSLSDFLRAAQGGQFGPQPMNVNQDVIGPLLQFTSVIALFMLPIVTMRTFSEEKRAGTMELLLTSPLTDVELVFGKFVGALGMYAAMLAVTLVYIGVLFLAGNPEPLPILSGYLGLFLLGAAFIAIGLFISSTTKNQIVAAAATFALLLFFWILTWLRRSVGPTMSSVLEYLSLTGHLEDFAKGVIDTKHLVYYLSFVTFGLFLSLKSVDTERWRG